ncbi:MAG: hypothetical protein ISS48_02545 [Candidatus Aenigmarchaeota archaeon]|nr:hypothetical protein [Candidatus Aenigmarchaeota archaeon]
MKVYLDANIVYGFFRSLVKSWEEKRKHEIPPVINFFISTRKLSIFSSVLTRCEIARRLRLDYGLEDRDIKRMWKYLEKLLRIKMIKEIDIDDVFVDFVEKNSFRSRINNVIHLFVCKNLDLTFVTGDKKIIEDGRKVYSKIMSYNDVRKHFS